MNKVMIYGASKGGQVVKTLLEECGYEVMGFLDDFIGLPLDKYNLDFPIVSEIYNNKIRLRVVDKAETFIHWSAYVNHTAKLGRGTFIKPKAMIGAFVETGIMCVIDSNGNIEHHTKLGDGVFISPSASIGSSCDIGDRTTIGINCTIQSGVKIGKDCLVCSGAIVFKDVPDNTIMKVRL